MSRTLAILTLLGAALTACPPDSGLEGDGGTEPDAAPPFDGGEDGRDAGTSDAGTSIDGGAVPRSDGGAELRTLQITSEKDALASYLISASPVAWNIFSGANIPLGRHTDSAHVSYHSALRFTGVAVPAGATITSARLSFYPANSVDASHNLYLNVYAERSADSAPFDPANYLTGRPDQRARTTAFIDHWLVRCNDGCTTLSEYDCAQRKLDCWTAETQVTCPKDLKALVQEVVNQPGWSSGQAISLLLVNAATDADGARYQDRRTFTGLDSARGASFAPSLSIEFEP